MEHHRDYNDIVWTSHIEGKGKCFQNQTKKRLQCIKKYAIDAETIIHYDHDELLC